MKRFLTSTLTVLAFLATLSFIHFIILQVIIAPLFGLTGPGDTNGQAPFNKLTTFLLATLSMTLSVLAVIPLFRRNKEAQPLKRFVTLTSDNARQALWGGAGGALLILAIAFAIFLPGLVGFEATSFSGYEIIGTLVLAALTGWNEEVAFRGFIHQELSENMSMEAAFGLSALAFALVHSNSPGFAWISFLNLYLAGVMLALAYVRYNGIWVPVGLHFAWNFVQGPILGFKVSGNDLPTWFLPEFSSAPAYLTGIDYGLEGTLVAAVVQLAAIAWLYAGLQKPAYSKLRTVPVVKEDHLRHSS